MTIKLNDFLSATLLGTQFLAVKSYSEVKDLETGYLNAYRLNVSIQDTQSPFFMEMKTVKVKNLSTTVSVDSLKTNTTIPIKLKGLNVGQFNGTLWFSCTDVIPAGADSKIKL